MSKNFHFVETKIINFVQNGTKLLLNLKSVSTVMAIIPRQTRRQIPKQDLVL